MSCYGVLSRSGNGQFAQAATCSATQRPAHVPRWLPEKGFVSDFVAEPPSPREDISEIRALVQGRRTYTDMSSRLSRADKRADLVSRCSQKEAGQDFSVLARFVRWSCRESNPGPTAFPRGFSVRSPLCLYSDLLITRTSQDDDPSRCLMSR